MLTMLEETRLRLSKATDVQKKAQFGQFFTPATIAHFMVGLFVAGKATQCRLLDAGAGIGSLANAFLLRCLAGELAFTQVQVSAFELDEALHPELNATLATWIAQLPLQYAVFGSDFIEQAVNLLQFNPGPGFTHAILNPPYKKINSHSDQRLLLRQAGIETVNLYSAFVALSLALLVPGGQMVAIIPRSFCNGPYYRPFRDFILERAAIRHMHLFASRNAAFRDDDVLQENIILMLERGGQQEDVVVTTSTDGSFSDLQTQRHTFERIVLPDDAERFIHVPTALGPSTIERASGICHALSDIGLKVSTGPVVDFRLKEHLRAMPEPGAVPLLYPIHFAAKGMTWPVVDGKKPNAICRNEQTEKWLYPNGCYCVVRRFSSKEEKRRIIASVLTPDLLNGAAMLGLENHLNVYHQNKCGLPEALAYGLAVFLNTSAVDENFRRSSGHTQVNATDLKNMKYPSRAVLMELGEWAMRCGELTQEMMDAQLGNLSLWR